ncbi:hypothetical protein M3P05_18120 [Sansalvadorimonas sp. 2012CJ34-2]|uniref:Uncharacterized protein n=1 Tax=Parendozoicomonas callyspongiae TaxID=2942213 RepID=A0ABT0PKD1_9GAMM|nr:hypothetical protein [Sansalvadorimonas sp. 2012CJ34-2]MCL6271840.1 hypothetical protein [Sansalvadorimonas sp. 2012CJ34-2]
MVTEPDFPLPDPDDYAEDRIEAFKRGLQKAINDGLTEADILDRWRSWYAVRDPDKGDIYRKVYAGYNRTDYPRSTAHSSTLALDEPLAVTFSKTQHTVRELINHFEGHGGPLVPADSWVGKRVGFGSASIDSDEPRSPDTPDHLSGLERQTSELESEVETSLDDIGKSLKSGRKTLTQLEEASQRLSESNKEGISIAHKASELKRKTRTLDTHTRTLSSRVGQQGQSVDQPGQGAVAVERVRARINKLEEDLRLTAEECRRHQEHCQELEEFLSQQKQESQYWKAEFEAKRSEAERLELENNAYMERERQQRVKLQALKQDVLKLKEVQGLQLQRKKEVERRLDLAEQGNTKFQSQISKLRALNRQLHKQVETGRVALQQQEDRVKSAEEELARTRAQLVSSEAKLEQQKNVLDSYKAKLVETEGKVSELQGDLSTKISESQNLRVALHQREQEFDQVLRDLQNQVGEWKSRAKLRMDERDHARVQCTEARLKLAKVSTELFSLKENVEKFKGVYDWLSTEASQIRDELEAEIKLRVKVEEELDQYKKTHSGIKSALKSSGVNFGETVNTAVAVTQLVNTLGQASADVSRLSKNNEKLEIQLATAQGLEQKANSDLERVKGESNKAKLELVGVRAQLVRSEQAVKKYSDEFSGLKQSNGKLLEEIEALKAENETLRVGRQSDGVELEELKHSHQQQVDKIQKMEAQHQVILLEHEAAVGSQNKEISELREQLGSASDELKNHKQKISKLQSEGADVRGKLEASEELRASERKENKRLGMKLAKQEAQLAELETEKNRAVRDLKTKGDQVLLQQQKMQDMEGELGELRSQLSSKQHELEAKNDQIQQERDRVLALEIKISAAEEDSTQKADRIKLLDVHVAELTQLVESTKAEADKADKQTKEYKDEIDQKNLEIAKLVEAQRKADLEFYHERETLDKELKLQSDIYDQQKSAWETEKLNAQRLEKERSRQIEDLERRLEETKSKYDQVRDASSEYEASRNEFECNYKRLEKKVGELFQANTALEEEIENIDAHKLREEQERHIKAEKLLQQKLKEEEEKEDIIRVAKGLEQRNRVLATVLKMWKGAYREQEQTVARQKLELEKLQPIEAQYEELAQHVSELQAKWVQLNESVDIALGEKNPGESGMTTGRNLAEELELAKSDDSLNDSQIDGLSRHQKLITMGIDPDSVPDKVSSYVKRTEKQSYDLNRQINILIEKVDQLQNDIKRKTASWKAVQEEYLRLQDRFGDDIEAGMDEILAKLEKAKAHVLKVDAEKNWRIKHLETELQKQKENEASQLERLNAMIDEYEAYDSGLDSSASETSLFEGEGNSHAPEESSLVKSKEKELSRVQRKLNAKVESYDALEQSADEMRREIEQNKLHAQHIAKHSLLLADQLAGMYRRMVKTTQYVIEGLGDSDTERNFPEVAAVKSMLKDILIESRVEETGWDDVTYKMKKLGVHPKIDKEHINAGAMAILRDFAGFLNAQYPDQASEEDVTDEESTLKVKSAVVIPERQLSGSSTISSPSRKSSLDESPGVSDTGSNDSGYNVRKHRETFNVDKPVIDDPVQVNLVSVNSSCQ